MVVGPFFIGVTSMPLVQRTFTFPTDAEGWTPWTEPGATMTHDSGVGNPAGSLKCAMTPQDSNGHYLYWEWSGTWEQLGVPSGTTIQTASIKLEEYCPNPGYGCYVGPHYVSDINSVQLGTTLDSRYVDSMSVDSAFYTRDGNKISIPGYMNSSSSQVKFIIGFTPGYYEGVESSAYLDNVAINVVYSEPPGKNFPRTSEVKPDIPEIYHGHPIADGLILDVPMFERGGSAHNIVSGGRGVTTGTLSWVLSKLGWGKSNATIGAVNNENYFHAPVRADSQSLELWLLVRNFRQTSPYMSSFVYSPDGSSLGFRFGDNTIDPQMGQVIGPTNTLLLSGSFDTNTLYHILITRSGTRLRAYVDGQLNAATTVSGDSTVTRSTRIFCDDVTTRSPDGAVFCVRKWNRELTASEVEFLYQRPWDIYEHPPAPVVYDVTPEVYAGTATISKHPTIAAGGVAINPYIGTATLSKKPVFGTPGPSPAAYWKFDQNVNDSSGNGVNGTGTQVSYSVDVPPYPASNTRSLDLRGNGYIALPGHSALNMGGKSVSFAFWLKDTKAEGYSSTSGERIIMEHDTWGNAGTYQVNLPDGSKLGFNFPETYAQGNYLHYTDPDLTNGTWHHWSVVFDDTANNVKVYKDATLVATQTINASIGSSNATAYIGQRADGSRQLDCQLDDFRIFPLALTQPQIASIATGGDASNPGAYGTFGFKFTGNATLSKHPAFGGNTTLPGRHFKFDGDATDSSGNGHHLTLVGSPTLSSGVSDLALDLLIDGQYAVRFNDDVPNWTSATFTAWIYPRSLTSYRGIVEFDPLTGIFLGSAGNNLGYSWNVNPETYGFSNGPSLSLNKWQFVAVVIDPIKATLYVGDNGILTSVVNTPLSGHEPINPFVWTYAHLYIGSERQIGGRYFDGLIDDVRVYDIALSLQEIGSLANLRPVSSARGTFTVPVYSGISSVTKHPSIDADGNAIIPQYTGLASLSKHPGFASEGGTPSPNFFGIATLSIHPTILSDGYRTIPQYIGQTTLSRHPTLSGVGGRLAPNYFGAATLSKHPVIGRKVVGHWKLDEGSGTVAYDSSGNGNHGTLYYDPQWEPGVYGSSLSFDYETHNFVAVPYSQSLDLSSSLTLSAWVKLERNWEHGFIDKTIDGNTNQQYQLFCSYNGQVLFRVVTGAGLHTIYTVVSLNAWHHLVGTWDGAMMRLFVDGLEVASGACQGPAQTGAGPLLIGTLGSGIYAMDGGIDDVRVYPMALTQAEITSVMNGASIDTGGVFSPPVYTGVATLQKHPVIKTFIDGTAAAWSFDEISGTTVKDISGNGYNGTIVGNVWSRGSGQTGLGITLSGDVSTYVSLGPVPRPDNNNWSMAIWVTGFQNRDISEPSRMFSWGWNGPLFRSHYGSLMLAHGGTVDMFANYNMTSAPTHLCVTREGNVARWYVNGVMTNEITNFSADFETSVDNVRVGHPLIYTESSIGTFDNPCLFNRALAASEVAYLASNGYPRGATGTHTAYYVGESVLSKHPTISASGGAANLYSGEATLTKHPTIYTVGGRLAPNFFGVVSLSRHPIFSGAGTRSIPSYKGSATLSTPHPFMFAKPTSGLFGWWQFTTDGSDSTNNGNTATTANGATISGGVLNIVGGAQQAQVSDNPFDMATGSFTVSFRVRGDLMDGQYRTMIAKRDNSSYVGWSIYKDLSQKVVFEASSTGLLPFFKTQSSFAMNAGVWYTVAATIDRTAGQMKVYVNGGLQQSVSITTLGSLNNNVIMSFGREVGQSSWNGALDNIKFYKRALTDAEVYNLAFGNLPGDIPVFGTLTLPIYQGQSTLSRKPTIGAGGVRIAPVYSGAASLKPKHPTITSSSRSVVSEYAGFSSLSKHPELSSFGIMDLPIYLGRAWMFKRPVIGGSANYVVPHFYGDAAMAVSKAVFSSSGAARVPIYTGKAVLTVPKLTFFGQPQFVVPTYGGYASLVIAHPMFHADGKFAVPVYRGTADLRVPGLVFSAGGISIVPVYTGSADLKIAVLITSSGVNVYEGFAYQTEGYIIDRVQFEGFILDDAVTFESFIYDDTEGDAITTSEFIGGGQL